MIKRKSNLSTSKQDLLITRQFLSSQSMMSLATIDQSHNPWVVCVKYYVDHKFDFYWQSDINSQHSQNIRLHPIASLCIFAKNSEQEFGFYAMVEIEELNKKISIARALSFINKNRAKPLLHTDLSGRAPRRLYRATVRKVWINDESHLKREINLRPLKH